MVVPNAFNAQPAHPVSPFWLWHHRARGGAGFTAFRIGNRGSVAAALRNTKSGRMYGTYCIADAFNGNFTASQFKGQRGAVDPKLDWLNDNILGIDHGSDRDDVRQFSQQFGVADYA